MQQRRRFKQLISLSMRLEEEAARLRSQAKILPQGWDRENLIRKARQVETAARIDEWLASPGLRPPL